MDKTIQSTVNRQKEFYYNGGTREYQFRKQQLEKLRKAIKDHEQAILDALKLDLNKSSYESYSAEIAFLYAEIDLVIKHLHKWMKPKKVKTPISHKGSSSYIYKEPYGVTLIIAPWNYPFQLAIAPLIGAIAAGNCAILKPSELTPTTSRLIHEILSSIFESEYIAVVEGGKEISKVLLDQRFDHIFFTGSVPVGKIIMEKASQHLTPVTLELGGKSPTIVDKDANLDLAAKRIAWGKYMNAGQTCIAPDYLYVHEDIKDQFTEKFKEAVTSFYGKNPMDNEEFTHIVSKRHFERLKSFLTNGKVVIGGHFNDDELFIEPTLLDNVSWQDPVMEDEIFGPILPMMTFDRLDEVVQQVRNQEKPLALYYFSEDDRNQEYILKHLQFGGGCINDTVYHVANPYLPFGGVGYSGQGAYHGEASFNVFTHNKSIVKQTTKFDLPFRYPDSKLGLKVIKRLFK